jgi:phospholipid/cholesterol/gamma-HCH transport system substrate-binding protein
METQEIKQNVLLGAFVLGGIILLLSAIFYLGKENSVFSRTFEVSAVFKNVEGLKEGDNVWLSGVKIGTVKRVQIISEGQVIVTLNLKDKQNEFIKKNATAFVGSDGLVGNKIVIIKPGDAAEQIHDHDTINSFSPTDTQELFNLAKEVGTNTKTITDDMKLITAKMTRGEGVLGELLQEGELSKEIRQLVASLNAAGRNTNQVTEEMKKLANEVNNGDGLMTKLIKDSSYAVTFGDALTNMKKVSENAKVMSEQLKEVTTKMNSSNNALGVLLADTAFANKLKNTLDNAQTASVKLDENMEALQHNFLLKGYFKKQEKAAAKAKK